MLDKSFEKDITDLLIRYRGIQSSIDNTEKLIEEVNVRISNLECEKNTLKLCKPVIDDIISKFSDSLLKKLEELVSIGLKQIFYDRNYSLQIKVVDKRNAKCVELFLNDDGNIIPVKNSCVAGGVLVVIASIIQVFFIVNMPNLSNTLFLDEQFSQISTQYIDTFIDFIKTLCKETKLTIVLITHDNKFMKYGDRIYVADKGKFFIRDNDVDE